MRPTVAEVMLTLEWGPQTASNISRLQYSLSFPSAAYVGHTELSSGERWDSLVMGGGAGFWAGVGGCDYHEDFSLSFITSFLFIDHNSTTPCSCARQLQVLMILMSNLTASGQSYS